MMKEHLEQFPIKKMLRHFPSSSCVRRRVGAACLQSSILPTWSIQQRTFKQQPTKTTTESSSPKRSEPKTLSYHREKSLEISHSLQSISQQEEALQEQEEYPFSYVERHTISILYHYHQILIQQPTHPLDKFIYHYLKQNKIGRNNKEVIVRSCYEMEKLYLLLDYLARKLQTRDLERDLSISLDQYVNRMNQIKLKQLGPNAHLLPKSVTFVEENKRSVLHWRVLYALYRERFYRRDVIHALHELKTMQDIPLNVKLSCPAQLFSMLEEDYGEEGAVEMAIVNNTEAPAFARVNDVRFLKTGDAEPLPKEEMKRLARGVIKRLASKYADTVGKITPSKMTPFGFRFEHKSEFRQWKEFTDGFFEIQDESSQYIVEELVRNVALEQMTGSKPLILDYCCGTGGKTFALAGALNGKGQIYMHDIRSEVLYTELRKRASRLGIQNIQPLEHGHAHWNNLKEKMNLVICDVPCSGTGTLRRNVELKYKINNQWVSELVKKQREIMDESLQYVKKGNYLLYSTCSVLKRENEQQVEFFLRKYKNLELVKTVKTIPKVGGGDGMFGALFKRIE